MELHQLAAVRSKRFERTKPTCPSHTLELDRQTMPELSYCPQPVLSDQDAPVILLFIFYPSRQSYPVQEPVN